MVGLGTVSPMERMSFTGLGERVIWEEAFAGCGCGVMGASWGLVGFGEGMEAVVGMGSGSCIMRLAQGISSMVTSETEPSYSTESWSSMTGAWSRI